MKRTVFFVSDGTGITAETLGHAVLNEFVSLQYEHTTFPFVDTQDKITAVVDRIDSASTQEGARPIVFSTLTDANLLGRLQKAHALVLDLLSTFIPALEKEFHSPSTHISGRFRGISNNRIYQARIDAVHFALLHDDGASYQHYEDANVIIVGVSRTGKTPTCLYLAMQFGVNAANFPLTGEHLDQIALPPPLLEYRDRLYGLTIDVKRLHQIRAQRRPNSNYASFNQCQKEVRAAERIFRDHWIPHLSTTCTSIEEISSRILQDLNLKRQILF